MIYQGTIYATAPKKKFLGFTVRPEFIHKLTTQVIEAESKEKATEKMHNLVEEYRKIDPSFFNKVQLKIFVEHSL